MRPRSRSAPPFTPRDFDKGWAYRDDGIENGKLCMDPADLAEFSSVEDFRPFHPRAMYWVDENKILKVFSYLIDVSVMVANMDLARTKLPVPRILRYGQSGNCSYILMERVPCPNFPTAMLQWKVDHLPPGVVGVVDWIVRELASLGLSHNDIVPRNLLVDMSAGKITSIVDWDCCAPIYFGGEYARAIRENNKFPEDTLPGESNTFHVFLRHSFDRTGEETILGLSDRNPARFRRWPLVKSKSYQLTPPPVTDHRYQSFSVRGPSIVLSLPRGNDACNLATEDPSHPPTYSDVRI
ncbi:hypothetical protein D9757_004959 [Collybiopsis confluens]|uniref:Aminoglycoside phosphotransferase domain-containing protein n=1 Tax=Collybiopsis confluens TaxID=2823264 RepID=A0A8H5HT67_9AGAR|nr:hypothetical protein D9757_004959 [Collybiopsis confluens]